MRPKLRQIQKNITANLSIILFFTIIYFKHKAYEIMIRLKNKFVPVALRMQKICSLHNELFQL